jgi:hypothetical protein
MDFYSKSKPDLLANNIKKTFNSVSQNKIYNTNPISDKLTDSIIYFLKEYIEPNKLIIIIIVSVVSYLYYCYDNKLKNKKLNPKREPFVNGELRKLNKRIDASLEHLPQNKQFTLNPLFPVRNQESNINYIPDNFKFNVNNQFIQPSHEPLTNKQLNPSQMIDPNYNYMTNNQTNHNDARNSYSIPNYQNHQDTTIENPYGFDNKFVSSDENYINQNSYHNINAIMTNQNQNQQYEQNMINNQNQYLPQSYSNSNIESNNGTNIMDLNLDLDSSTEIEPPYSDEIRF